MAFGGSAFGGAPFAGAGLPSSVYGTGFITDFASLGGLSSVATLAEAATGSVTSLGSAASGSTLTDSRNQGAGDVTDFTTAGGQITDRRSP